MKEIDPVGSKHGFSVTKSDAWLFLTPKELAKQIKVSRKTLERWRKENKGPPFVKIDNNRIRYLVRELDAWVDANMSQKKSPVQPP